MNKEKLIYEIRENLLMIYENYCVLNHYQIEFLEDTLKDCLKYIKGDKK